MKLFDLIKTFAKDEDGAVTVDWVVLTAAIVLMGVAVVGGIRGAVTTLGGEIAEAVSTVEISGD